MAQHMTKLSAFCAAFITTLALASCSNSYREAREETRAIDREIIERSTIETPKVRAVSRPPVRVERVRTADTPEWVKEEFDSSIAELPLMMALQLITPKGVSIWLDGDVNPAKIVTAYSQGSKEDALNVIERDSGYGISFTKTKLEVRRWETETFVMSLPVGTYSAQLGTQGQQSQQNATLGAGASPRIEGQFVNVSFEDVDVFTQIKKVVEILLRKETESGNNGQIELEGAIEVAPSLGIITVRTTPPRMVNVRRAIADFETDLTKQVLVEIRVLEFRSNLGREDSIDWDLLRQTSKGTLNFFVPGTNTLSAAGSAFAWSGVGRWDGSQAFIRALKEQGQVSTGTPITALLLNNQPNRIAQVLNRQYADEVKTQVTENVVTATVTRATAVEGVDMMLIPKIGDDFVGMHVAGKLSKIVGEEDKTYFDADLKFMAFREAELSFRNRLPYGSTVVIGSIRQDSTTSEETRSIAGGGKGLRKERVETLVLLTPRRVH
jgi:MSHA biogenesis protein MshL